MLWIHPRMTRFCEIDDFILLERKKNEEFKVFPQWIGAFLEEFSMGLKHKRPLEFEHLGRARVAGRDKMFGHDCFQLSFITNSTGQYHELRYFCSETPTNNNISVR